VQENSDYLPHPNADFDVTVAGWLCRPPFTKPLTNLHTGLLWRTLRNYPVYRCPLDRTNAPLFEWRLQKYSSYIMNWAVTGFRITRATHKLSRFRPEVVLFWQGDENCLAPSAVPRYVALGKTLTSWFWRAMFHN